MKQPFQTIWHWGKGAAALERRSVFGSPQACSNLPRPLAQRALASLALRVIAAFLSLVTSVALARVLGVKGFGTYSYTLTLVGLLSVPLTLGLPQLLVREVAAYDARGQWGTLGGLLRRANQVVLAASLLLVMVAIALSSLFAERLEPSAHSTFIVAVVMLPLMALAAMRMATLQGLGYVVLRQLPEGVYRPLLFLLFFVPSSLVLERGQVTPAHAMGIQLVAAGLAFVIGAWLLHRRLPAQIREASLSYEHRTWAKGALPLLLLGGVQFSNEQLGLLMLGAMEGAEATGLYRVATRVAECIPLVLLAANAVLAPMVSRLYAQDDLARLQQLVTGAARAVLSCTVPMALALMVLAPWLLRTVFGEEFAPAATALSILSIGQLFNAGMGSVGLLLIMTGHAGDTLKGMGLGAVLHVVLNALLIPRFGIDGAASATAISLITWNILLAVWVYKRLGLHTTALGPLRFRRAI